MFDGIDVLELSEDEMRSIRGRDIAMIFQDPMTALNPVFTVGEQISEAIRIHSDLSKKAAMERTVDLLSLVGVPEPKRRAYQHPHEYSGGMRQRAMIAMAICNDPKLLIADEPTTALDVTVQAQVMEVLHDVQEATGSAMMLITHDLGLVAGSADRVQVMYASRLMETGGLDDIFYESCNPYTMALLNSIPDLDGLRDTLEADSREPTELAESKPRLCLPPPMCARHRHLRRLGTRGRLRERQPRQPMPPCRRPDESCGGRIMNTVDAFHSGATRRTGTRGTDPDGP